MENSNIDAKPHKVIMVMSCLNVNYLKHGLKTLRYAHTDVVNIEQKTLNLNGVADAHSTRNSQI